MNDINKFNIFNRILVERSDYISKNRINAKYYILLSEKYRNAFIEYVNNLNLESHILYYDETDELNHRFYGFNTKFTHNVNEYSIFCGNDELNSFQQSFIDELELSYRKNAEEHRNLVYSKIKENLKGKTVQIDALELFHIISFLDASRKLVDEGRLPYRKFEEGAFKLVKRIKPMLDLDKKLSKSAPGLDYQIFDNL